MSADIGSGPLPPLNHYRRLLGLDAGERLNLVLLDADGALLAARDAPPDAELAARFAAAVRAGGSFADDRSLLLALPDSLPGGRRYLGLHCARSAGGPAAVDRARLAALGDCLREAFLAAEELDEMAGELEHRYEELNLIYSLEETAEHYADGSSDEQLRRMLEDYSGYLDIASVILLLPGAQIDLEVGPPASGPDTGANGLSEQAAAEWRRLQPQLQQRLRRDGDALVFNDLTGAAGGESALRIAGVPVRDVHGGVQGMVAAAKSRAQSAFTNSDRRLLRVLAEQVATLVNANYDRLTGLLNRRGFAVRLDGALFAAQAADEATDEAAAGAASRGHLLLVDVDQFSVLNDSCGHAAGDELLKRVAARLLALFEGCSAISRLNGDEFGLLLESDTATALRLAERAARSLRGLCFVWQERRYEVSATVAVVPIDTALASGNAVLSAAEVTAALAKERGRGQVRCYDPQADSVRDHSSTVEWLPRIQWALAENRLQLFAQEIRPAPGRGGGSHYEVLLRLLDERDQIVEPFQLISAAERYRLMPEIDRRVVSDAIAVLREVLATRPDLPLKLSVNLSGQSLNDEFFDFLHGELDDSALCQRLCLEITETAAVANLSDATRLIESLRARGVRFALDDFGSGLSSFGYLKSLPVDTLKIDGSIVREVLGDPVSVAMVESINRVAHLIGLCTVAEFVEDAQVGALVAALGSDYLQGYGIGRPEPLSALLARLRAEAGAGGSADWQDGGVGARKSA